VKSSRQSWHIFRRWGIQSLALMTVVFLFSAKSVCAETLSLVAEVQAVQDSLSRVYSESEGVEKAALAYQLGFWCQSPGVFDSLPWDDRIEALFGLAMFKCGRYDLVMDENGLILRTENNLTGPHWSKGLRDIRHYQLEERFNEMRESYIFLWPKLMPDVRLLAEADLLARQHLLDSALVVYAEALQEASSPVMRGEILLGMGDVHYRLNRFEESLQTLRDALHGGGFGDEALFLTGRTLIRLGRTREAVELFRYAIAINPGHEAGHYYLGNGYTPLNYSQIGERYPTLFAHDDVGEVLETARLYMEQGSFEGAREMLLEVQESRPDLMDPPLLLAELAWQAGEYDRAEVHCFRALELCPDYGRAHAILARVQEGRRLRVSDRRLAVRATYDEVEQPEIPGIEAYVVNWESLASHHQKQVALAVEPWKRFVPVLVATGQTHYIKPLHEKLSEAPEMESMRDQRISLDSRLWDDVRGAGGHHTVTGVEDVERMRFGGYNTVVHELTHQVHGLYTDREKKRLEEAYRAAKAREATGVKTFMSRYQGSTVWEYFAEGVNAYVTPAIDNFDEREMLRERLVALDSTLLDLVEEFLAIEDVTPYYTVGYVSATYQELEKGHADSAWARLQAIDSLEAEVREVLNARCQVASLRDDDSTAIVAAERAVELYPTDPTGYQNLMWAKVHAPGGTAFNPVDFLQNALQNDSVEERHRIQTTLAKEAWRTENYGLALTMCDEALAVQGDFPGALWVQALAWADSGLCSGDSLLTLKGGESFGKAIRLRSGTVDLRYDYTRVLLMAGDLAGAEQQLLEAEALKPNDPETVSYRAWLSFARGDTLAARELAGAALMMEPVPDVTRVIAAAVGAEGEDAEALVEGMRTQEPRYVYNPRNYWYMSVGRWEPWYGVILNQVGAEAVQSDTTQ